MPTIAQMGKLNAIDAVGETGKIKSLLATRTNLEITLKKGSNEKEYHLSIASANYNAMASTAMLAYTTNAKVTIGLHNDTVVSVGIGDLTVMGRPIRS